MISEIRVGFFVSIVAVFCLLASCTAAVRKDSTRSMTIIGTADLQGMLDPIEMKIDLNGDGNAEKAMMGGISRISSLIHRIGSEQKDRVIAVSTGDDLMNRYFHLFKAEAIFKLMSEAGYDIYAPGNHEFDKGPEVFADGLKLATFKCLCSDLTVKGTALDGLCQPWLIRDIAGIRVGFFSLMTENFPFVTAGRNVRLARNNTDTARYAVSELKKQGATLIIALTHIGAAKDREIAETVPDIDVIFGGHSHDYIASLEKVGKTIIVNGGEKGAYLVRLDISADINGKMIPDQAKYQTIPIQNDIEPDAKIEAMLSQYRQSFPKAVVLGRTEVEWNMTKEALRQGESSVANLINDLMRKQFNADIVLNNAGAFRGQKVYPAGDVTDAMLKEIDEFGNYAFASDIKGRYIMEILERSAACYDEGGLLHPSGLRYVIDLKKPAQQIVKNVEGHFTISTRGERVTGVKVLDKIGKWSDLEPEKTYRVLSNSYLVNQEGDGYFWFKRYGQNLNNTYSTFYSIMADFVEANGVLNPSPPDQRLTVIK